MRVVAFLVLAGAALAAEAAGLPELRVSANRRFLVTAEGRPFFWLGDTAWELFHRLNREEADRYLAALQQQGAGQMQHGRWLLESRPFLDRIPDDSVIVPDRVATSVPGAGRYRFVATRDQAGTFAMVYAPVGRPFTVRMNAIQGAFVKAWWFNPRDGSAREIGTFPNGPAREFTPPDPGEMIDWVLVLDDAALQYPAPGTRSPIRR